MHVKLGSWQAPQIFDLIKSAHQNDNTFTNFCVKLNSFLNIFLPAWNIPLPDGRRVCLQSDHTVTECQFLQVNYESMVDWQQYMDYLWCNPWFFNAPWFDYVFIQSKKEVIIGPLVLLFECPVGNGDKHLNLFRVRVKLWAQAEFILIRSIIHRC
ncbi:uncharacterized protein EDB91DRAFT_1062912 [Suillus paluster]|uniref:uncharacterized protein n=1 Tax=Suillus paluster TaxID=48578 RepID=UPI001B86200D|nr:uncharacterized protein EDB91DRAFT_1062912 [Suillus paluster]KAG1724292.1 hypothetical protein EDB91DRAFT_1062912 [Suillus paluster]